LGPVLSCQEAGQGGSTEAGEHLAATKLGQGGAAGSPRLRWLEDLNH
jgi:hypothetical protein